ncbi:MAG: hypothetical protein EOM50_05430 [Erysipelotrichia bacterium]|nr:hypothetical protein [Erysipelotrichia bacterium]
MSEETINAVKATGEVAVNAGKKIGAGTSNIIQKGNESFNKAKNDVYNAIDVNGDGNVDVNDLIIMAFKTPGVSIYREEFLRKELCSKCDKATVEKAISTTPFRAGVSQEIINDLADETIKYERNCVSGISTALGIPGGIAIAATIPADIAQYYGYMLRTTQKLLYLYGFPQIQTNNNGTNLDSETMNTLILCLGTMYGVANANNAIKAMAKALASGVEKKLINKALTKGTIYPIVKSVAKWFGVNMTKKVFAGFFKKSIPVIGGVISGGLTFVTFKPCCDRLKETLENTMLSNPNNYIDEEDVIDIKIE